MTQDDGIRKALELTRRELQAMNFAPLVGGWLWRGGLVSFFTFLPNAMYVGRGDLLNLLLAAGRRARWLSGEVYGTPWESEEVGGAFRATVYRRIDDLPGNDTEAHAAAWSSDLTDGAQ
jgi:hypothetical protein